MRKWVKGKAPENEHGEEREEAWSAAADDELIAFAREYFSTDFPNPERLGCPSRETLLALVRAGQPPDRGLTAHLFGCSECFNEYRAALAQRRRAVAAAPVSRWRERGRRLIETSSFKLGAALTACVALAIAGYWAWSSRPAPRLPLQAQASPQASATLAPSTPENERPTAAASPAPTTAPRPERAGRREGGPAPGAGREAMLAVDLSAYGHKRATGAEVRLLQLPKQRLRLRLALPEGSLAGEYTIILLSDVDKELIRHTEMSRDGKWLTTRLDLSTIAPGDYRLSLARKGEAARVYQVKVTEAAKPPGTPPREQ